MWEQYLTSSLGNSCISLIVLPVWALYACVVILQPVFSDNVPLVIILHVFAHICLLDNLCWQSIHSPSGQAFWGSCFITHRGRTLEHAWKKFIFETSTGVVNVEPNVEWYIMSPIGSFVYIFHWLARPGTLCICC